MKFIVTYGQIRPSERRIIYRNSIIVNGHSEDTVAAAVARTFGIRTLDSDWVIIDVEPANERGDL